MFYRIPGRVLHRNRVNCKGYGAQTMKYVISFKKVAARHTVWWSQREYITVNSKINKLSNSIYYKKNYLITR